jgi:3-hydroxyacyl-CoA dehydrogenase
VVAPQGLTLGGACELSLHSDKVVPAAESYIGLVELGVGLIPGGGGTKEFALRAADEMHEDEPETITLKNRFLTIATAKVSTSADEAFQMGILKKGRDFISINPDRRIADAKNAVMELYQDGYTAPVHHHRYKSSGPFRAGCFLYAGIHWEDVAGKLCN